ncbi:MAG: prepilin peptidase [Paracoccaceae bacterium]
MAITVSSALWFLPFAVPICIWVALSDMRTMKIPNTAVLALTAVFFVVALVALPLDEIPWRALQLVVVLAVGFGLNMISEIGAGDAKFAAAMAPFIAPGDFQIMLYIFAGVLMAAFVTHRIARRVAALRAMAPGWASWTSKKFPMGLALGGALIFYLAIGALNGV